MQNAVLRDKSIRTNRDCLRLKTKGQTKLWENRNESRQKDLLLKSERRSQELTQEMGHIESLIGRLLPFSSTDTYVKAALVTL